MERLDKLIASQCGLSRSEARERIRGGAVVLNGQVCRDPSKTSDPLSDEIIFAGKRVVYERFVYLMLNKPAGILSASNDRSRQTVVDLVPPAIKRAGLFPVGRLDRDTTGLLLLTDDGDFAHRIISPKNKIQKCYYVTVDGDLKPEMADRFREGVVLADGTKCRPAGLTITDGRHARLVLDEGKYHEVKRMFGTVGLGVNELHRESIGELQLPPDLAVGECRKMTKNEIENVQKIGGYTF